MHSSASNTTSNSSELLQAFHNTHYHQLCTPDEISYGNYHILKDKNYQLVLITVIKQLNLLLHINNTVFWQHLQIQASLFQNQQVQPEQKWFCNLKMCLNSCLAIFSKKKYLPYIQQSDPNLETKINNLPKEGLALWSQLKKIVFLIFFRISKANSDRQISIMFDNWYLDSCKLLDICMIYGQANPNHVKAMISNVYQCFPTEYWQDYIQVIELTKAKLQQICHQILSSCFDVEKFLRIQTIESKYHLPFEALHQSSATLMFKIIDVLFNLENILNYFPIQCKLRLLETTIIYKRFIMIHCKLTENVTVNWKLGTLKNKLESFVCFISQKIASFTSSSLTLIHEFVRKAANKLGEKNEHVKLLKKTYINIVYCLLISAPLFYQDKDNQQKKRLYLRYEQALASLVLHFNSSQQLFFCESTIRLFDHSHPNFIFIKKAVQFQANTRRILKFQSQQQQQQALFNTLKQSVQQQSKKEKEQIRKREQVLSKIMRKNFFKEYEDQPFKLDSSHPIDWNARSKTNQTEPLDFQHQLLFELFAQWQEKESIYYQKQPEQLNNAENLCPASASNQKQPINSNQQQPINSKPKHQQFMNLDELNISSIDHHEGSAISEIETSILREQEEQSSSILTQLSSSITETSKIL